jgi:hypothetical protein
MLKGYATSGTIFMNRLTSGTNISYVRSCSTSGNELQFNNENRIKFSPNPAENFVEFELENIELPTQLIISDMTGRIIISKKITSSKEIVNISDIESGSYFVTLNGKLNQNSQILIKK